MNPLKIAVAGLGTVGGGTVSFLQKNAKIIEARAGRKIEVVAVSARDKSKARDLDLSAIRWVEDTAALADLPDVDVVCELIGGVGGVAQTLCEKTLASGKALVTANKALLATHGAALAALAEKNNVPLMFEGAVAGGIPAIKTVRESLAGNQIASIKGIMNGTCNYILTRMANEGMDFAPALAEAQRLGYAEADPSADVDGFDTAHKLAILAALAFGVKPNFKSVSIEGLRRITGMDLAFAAELGCRIKLLGVAKPSENGLEQRVSPCLVPVSSSLAHVDGVLNAVQLNGDAVGPLALIGRGAGSEATASSVLSDLIDIARGVTVKPWGRNVSELVSAAPADPSQIAGCWYIRLKLSDKAGVLADIAAILRDEVISIKSLLQHEGGDGKAVPVIIVTHEVNQAAIAKALSKIAALETVWDEPFCLRIENGA